jgi:hypothetical protein
MAGAGPWAALKEMMGAPTGAWSGDARDSITEKCELMICFFVSIECDNLLR